ncbi:MAG: hypothetical protein IPM96_20310 [Ignavibacteria bacterium]|nr:hypothetical protein [Ignavibacteria bacterium]
MIDEYNDGAIPLKIRKINLLQAVELPTAAVEILETGEISSLKKKY